MHPAIRWPIVIVQGMAAIFCWYLASTLLASGSSLALRPVQVSIESVESDSLPTGYVEISGGLLAPIINYAGNPPRPITVRGAYLTSETPLQKWKALDSTEQQTKGPSNSLLVGMDEEQVKRLWPVLKDDTVWTYPPEELAPIPLTVTGESVSFPGEDVRPEFAGVTIRYLDFEEHPLRALSFHVLGGIFNTFFAYYFLCRVKPPQGPATPDPGWTPESAQERILV